MKQRKYKAFLMVFLLLSTYIVGILNLKPEKALADNWPVNITGYDVSRQYGSGTVMEIGESIDVHIEFDLNPLPAGAKVGDTFEIAIPSGEYFSYHKQSGTLPLNSEDPLVTFRIVGDKVIFTLCDLAIESNGLTNGVLELTAKSIKTTDKYGPIDSGGDGSVPKIDIKPAPDPTDYPETNRPFPNESKYLFKNGQQLNGENAIAWSMRVNYSEYGRAFDEYTKDKGATKIGNKFNGMVVDHLTPGTTFREDSLYVTVPTYIITSDEGKPEDPVPQMGDRQIGDYGGSLINFADVVIEFNSGKNPGNPQSFVRLYPAAGQSYDDFAAYVQSYPDLNGGQRAYGVYKHADATESVLIAFGTVPGAKHYYEDLRKEFDTGSGPEQVGILKAIEEDTSLTLEQKKQLKAIYGRGSQSPSDGAILAYNVGFYVDVDTTKYGSGTYKNGIDFVYGNDGKESTVGESGFQDINQNLDANFLLSNKKVSGEEGQELAESKVFKFNVVDKRGNIYAYGKTRTSVTHKGTEVEIDFYRDAAYTIPVENANKADPNYWGNFLVDGQWYYIEEVDTDGYEVHIQDTLAGSESNRFRYLEGVEQRWRFAIVNLEPIQIEAAKKIVGDGNLSSNKEFKFELRDTRTDPGTPVAYGKTTVDAKNAEKKITFYLEDTYTTEITNWKKMEISGTEYITLEDGVTYQLVEIDNQGYEVSYYNGIDEQGDPISGDTYTANYEEGGKITFLVENKDTFNFAANKKIQGSGNLQTPKTFTFELKDIAADSIAAYGKVDVGVKGSDHAIEFFTTSDYDPVNKITDWTTVLEESKAYRLEETGTHHYAPSYTGGIGAANNEFVVAYNNSPPITINTENKDTFDFSASKKVTGDGIFEGEDFKFQLLNSTNQIVAYGKASVSSKDTEVAIDFYTDPNDLTTKITDWTKVLTEGETYQLKEVDDTGYSVTYKNQDGTETNQFTPQFNTGNSFEIKVENKRDKVPLPQTGGQGFHQQLMLASGIIFLVVLAAGVIEYRRRKAGV